MRFALPVIVFGVAVAALGGVEAAATAKKSKITCDEWVEEDFEGDLEQACGDGASWSKFKDERTCNREQDQCEEKCCGLNKREPDDEEKKGSDEDVISDKITCTEWLADNRGDIEYACEREAGWISFEPFNYAGKCIEDSCKETCCGE